MNSRLGACLILVITLVGTSLARADTDRISITAGPGYDDGVFTDYFMDFEVEGSGIIGGSVMKGGSPVCDLQFSGVGLSGPELWSCEIEDFGSLQDLCLVVGFGDFDFEITDGDGLDSVTLAFNPGCTGSCQCIDSIAGHPEITSPATGTVPPIPGDSSLCWTCSSPNTCGDGNYDVTIVDSALEDIASDFLRNVSLPTCWNPGICMEMGIYAFSSSAFELFDDLVPKQTDQGDPFLYGSAFESFNFVIFGVTAAPPTTPPGVPEGGGVTEPMRVEKLSANGTTLGVFWDAESCCGAGDHHLVWALGDGLPAIPGGTYTLEGSECGLGTTGAFTWSAVPDPVAAGDSRAFLWWLVLADDGTTTEGSWGLDSTDSERNGSGAADSSGQCGITTKDLSNACGR